MSTINLQFPDVYPYNEGYMSPKIEVIKAIRAIAGYGLKDAKDASEKSGVQTFILTHQYANDPISLSVELRTLQRCGVTVVSVPASNAVGSVLEKLRAIAADCIGSNEFDLADEIYALVLKNKER